jgi:hypothetical protein
VRQCEAMAVVLKKFKNSSVHSRFRQIKAAELKRKAERSDILTTTPYKANCEKRERVTPKKKRRHLKCTKKVDLAQLSNV